jgi:CMP-N-acetylneuraminic acid synthetase
MKILTIIPARMGSKRIPQKNLAMLGEWPLFVWAINAAHAAGQYCVHVSTDSPITANIAQQYGCHAPHRPPALAGDDVPMINVVRELASRHADSGFDAVLLLQPTSPFRTADDIRAAIKLMEENGAESVISVTDAPSDLVFEVGHAGRLRNIRAIDPLVVPNGAIFLIRTEFVFTSTWWDCVAYAYRMPKERSIDIDTAADLEQARDMVAKMERSNAV